MAYVLIVDDDEDFADTVSRVLQREGHETSIELDTQSGLASMETRCPDLVVLDVMFPEDNSAGFEMARTITTPYDLICVTGSFALVGETMEVLQNLEPEETLSR